MPVLIAFFASALIFGPKVLPLWIGLVVVVCIVTVLRTISIHREVDRTLRENTRRYRAQHGLPPL